MKIFLCDPANELKTKIKQFIDPIKGDELIVYGGSTECMNNIIAERPGLLILDLDKEDINTSRVIDICQLHEIPLLAVLDKKNETQIETLFGIEIIDRNMLDTFTIKDIDKLKKSFKGLNIINTRLTRFSNRQYPFLIRLIIIFLLIEPLIKIGYLWEMTGYSLDRIVDNIIRIPLNIEFFEFWLLFPLSGLLLLVLKRFMFVIFLFIQIYSVFVHLTYEKFSWPYVSKSPHISSVILLILNLLIIIYLLISDERKRLIDRTKVWWRQSPRYDVLWNCTVCDYEGRKQNTSITNISNTGAFLIPISDINIGDKLSLNIDVDKGINVEVRAVMLRECADSQGVGVHFLRINKEIKNILKQKIKSCH